MVAETRVTDPEELSRLEGALIAGIAGAIGLPPDRVVLVPPGTVPKTPSGKLRRGTARDLYVARRLGARPHLTLGRRLALLRGAVLEAVRPVVSRAPRALYLGYLGVASVAAIAPLVLGIWALVAVLPSRRAAFVLGRFGARVLLRLAGCRLHVEGLENLRGDGPRILASNHASYVDVLALMATVPLDFVFVAKREVRSWPLVGAFVRREGHPTVDRWDPKRSVADAQALAGLLRAGDSVCFFPEGTFTRATGLRPFRLGAFETSAATGAPVIPVALQGTRRALRDGAWLPRPALIHVWIGAAIAPPGEGWDAALELRERTADQIAAHCGEPRLDLLAGGPVRPEA